MNLDQLQQKNNQTFLFTQHKSKLQQSYDISNLFKNDQIHIISSFLIQNIILQLSLDPSHQKPKQLKNQMIKSGNYVQKKHLLPIHIIQISIETFYTVKENMKDLLSNLIKQGQNKDQKPNKSEQTLFRQAIAQSCIKQYKSLLSNVRKDQGYIITKWSNQIHKENIISQNKPVKVEKQIEMEEQKKQILSEQLINIKNQQMFLEQKIDRSIRKTKNIKKNRQENKKIKKQNKKQQEMIQIEQQKENSQKKENCQFCLKKKTGKFCYLTSCQHNFHKQCALSYIQKRKKKDQLMLHARIKIVHIMFQLVISNFMFKEVIQFGFITN